MLRRHSLIVTIVTLCSAATLLAQNSATVEQLSARSEHMPALAAFDRLPKRQRTLAATLAAARSAWAIGLNDRAISEYDHALQFDEMQTIERARTIFARGVIDLQEQRPQVARTYAERALALIDGPSPLRARIIALRAQAEMQEKLVADAEKDLSQAIEEASNEDLPEYHFLRAQCRTLLGKRDDARVDLEAIPLEHPRTPDAVRDLAKLALDSGLFEEAQFWLRKGRRDFPERFADSWVDYGLVRAALGNSDQTTARAAREEARKRLAPSDPWLNLLEAESEESAWRERNPTGQQ